MIKNMDLAEKDAALRVADIMAARARTAPKAHGADKIITIILDGEDKDKLADAMDALYAKTKDPGLAFIQRDAGNVRASHCVVLIAAKATPSGVPECGLCGFGSCAGLVKAISAARTKRSAELAECQDSYMYPIPSCSFSATDLGIAVGSAVSAAAQLGIDNRVMYSVGRGAISMGLFGDDVELCYGIPLYTGAKSIYFDRNPGAKIL